MKKKVRYLFLVVIFFAFAQVAMAQQLPQITNYVINDFVLNPALSGTNEDFEVKSDNRYQWVGITDAPRTYVLSVNGPYQSKNMGYGGYIYNDVTGPTSRTGFALSYGYHVQLTETLKLSMGLSAGMEQFAVDGTQITVHDPGDPVLTNGYQSVIVPDFGFGAQIYTDKYWLGLSIPQLYEARLKFFDYETSTLSNLATHFYLTGGYKYELNENIRLEPSFLLQYVAPVPPQLDITIRAIYKKMLWAGLGVRFGDAITAMIGYTFKDYLMFAYSYDLPISTISSYTTGTHEIMFGLRFKNKPKKG